MIFSMVLLSMSSCALSGCLPRFFAACSWRKDSKAARAASALSNATSSPKAAPSRSSESICCSYW